MSSNAARELIRADREEQHFYGLTPTAWLKVLVITLLMAALFRFNLSRIWSKTNPFTGADGNWGHTLILPLIGIYYLYANREKLLAARVYTAWSGLAILLFGILFFFYGIYPGYNDFFKDFGMVIALFGVVTFLTGWDVMKIAWFPIAFLVCGIPWPGLFYSALSWPLQTLAAKVSVKTLVLCGIDASNSGTKIFIAEPDSVRALNVAEACSGLKSLMTFISVAAAVAFLSARPLWQKAIVTLSAIPIAVFCNVMRVAGQGLLDHYVSHKLSEGFAHQFVGLVMLIPAFFLILLVCWILDQLFIDEADEQKRAQSLAKANVTLRQRSNLSPVPAAAGVAALMPSAAIAAPAPATRKPGAAPRPAPVAKPAVSSPPAARMPPRPTGLTSRGGSSPSNRPPLVRRPPQEGASGKQAPDGADGDNASATGGSK